MGRLCAVCLRYRLYIDTVVVAVADNYGGHFVVPTGSMEPTLIPDDRILVNKWVMGARVFDVWDNMEGKERWNRLMKKIE